jgi:hypothetical protein
MEEKIGRRIRFKKSDGDRLAESIDNLTESLVIISDTLEVISANQIRIAERQLNHDKNLQLIAQFAEEALKWLKDGNMGAENLKNATRSILEGLREDFEDGSTVDPDDNPHEIEDYDDYDDDIPF